MERIAGGWPPAATSCSDSKTATSLTSIVIVAFSRQLTENTWKIMKRPKQQQPPPPPPPPPPTTTTTTSANQMSCKRKERGQWINTNAGKKHNIQEDVRQPMKQENQWNISKVKTTKQWGKCNIKPENQWKTQEAGKRERKLKQKNTEKWWKRNKTNENGNEAKPMEKQRQPTKTGWKTKGKWGKRRQNNGKTRKTDGKQRKNEGNEVKPMQKQKTNENRWKTKDKEGKWRKSNGKRKEKLAKPKKQKNPSPYSTPCCIFRFSHLHTIRSPHLQMFTLFIIFKPQIFTGSHLQSSHLHMMIYFIHLHSVSRTLRPNALGPTAVWYPVSSPSEVVNAWQPQEGARGLNFTDAQWCSA